MFGSYCCLLGTSVEYRGADTAEGGALEMGGADGGMAGLALIM